jgi:hypothetical protein
MEISIDTKSYNDRRYGKPWIAKITLEGGNELKFNWGHWVGDPGDAGMLIIDLEPGDFYATGQKDFRKPKKSAPDYFELSESGESETTTKPEIFKSLKNKLII